MTIASTPEVGKLLVLKGASTEVYPWYREGGKITRISGQRVYYFDTQQDKERFTHDVGAVCDTPAEVDKLLDFSKRGQDKVASMLTTLKEEDELLWAAGAPAKQAAKKAAAAPKPAPTTAAEPAARTRRVR